VKTTIRKLNSEPRKEYPFFSASPRRSEAVISSGKVEISSTLKTCDMSDISALAPDFRYLGKGGRAGFEAIRKNC